jgi:putative flippase GtrA
MHEFFDFSERISAACGLFAAFCVNFVSIRFFVFSSTSPTVTQIGKFAAASLSFRLLEYTGFSIFFGLGMHYILALTITMVMGTICKYFFYKKFVFR